MREVDVREIMAQPPSGGCELKLTMAEFIGLFGRPAAFGRL